MIELLGDKIRAKHSARDLDIPVIPGSEGSVENAAEALKAADKIGYPVIVKAAAGGGGKGMRIVQRPGAELADILAIASHEAEKAFSDGTMYLEKYLENPRHVEIQIVADRKGNVVHLGERDCTVQQNHQKLVEESPSLAVDAGLRTRMGNDAVRLLKTLGYTGAGTVEFLVKDGKHYFMEVNARVQVEHPVSEMVTGVDIIRQQILAASDEPLEIRQEDVRLGGVRDGVPDQRALGGQDHAASPARRVSACAWTPFSTPATPCHRGTITLSPSSSSQATPAWRGSGGWTALSRSWSSRGSPRTSNRRRRSLPTRPSERATMEPGFLGEVQKEGIL